MKSNNDTPQKLKADDEIDLGQLTVALLSQKWQITFITLVVGIFGVFFALNTPSMYRANALMQMETKSGSLPLGLSGGLGALASLGGGGGTSATEIALMQSRLVLGRATAALNFDWNAGPKKLPLLGELYKKFNHLVLSNPGQLRAFATGGERILLGFLRVPQPWIGKELTITKLSAATFSVLLPDGSSAIGTLGEMLQNAEIGFAMKILKLEGELSREFYVEQKSEEVAIKELRKAIDISEVSGSSLLSLQYDTTDEGRAAVILDAVIDAYLTQDLSYKAATAETGLAALEERINAANIYVKDAEKALDDHAISNEQINIGIETQALLTQISTLENDLAAIKILEAEVSRKYTRNHPNYLSVLDERAAIEKRLEELKQEGSSLPVTQREFFALSRQLETAVEIYSRLLVNAQELRVLQADETGSARVVDYAMTSNFPVSPNKKMIVTLSLVLGFFIGIGFALVKHSLNNSIRSVRDVEALGLSILGTFGFVALKKVKRNNDRKITILAEDDPNHTVVESFRKLRASINFRETGTSSRTLAITSASSDVGRAFCAVNLATVYAQDGKKICLVDADMRRGRLHEFFSCKKDVQGVAEVLAGEAQLSHVKQDTNIDNLTFISTGNRPQNPSDLLMRTSFKKTVASLEKEFDFVIFNCSPALEALDPMIVAREVGTCLAVLRYGVTEQGEINALKKTFDSHNAEISGAIINDFPADKRNERKNYTYRAAHG
ncbi:polysaccharide biosynthesis tyrosine autokinase [Pseudopelagicola sp. nBUS_20]|uniref:polysaccharide biosynthesis tyrosine autokinase n=1 Tax=Pseudopelagicola sp. nBUS_20 TaxID=3395317 RepID=UPI003EBDA2E4